MVTFSLSYSTKTSHNRGTRDSKPRAPSLLGSPKEATQVIGGDFYACGCGKWSTSKLTESGVKMIEFDLNTHDCEALLRHCESFVPEGG
jgi:hypothetical protein